MALNFPDIDPVALAVGPVVIRWYALAYIAGILIGWRYALMRVKNAAEGQRPNKDDIDDFVSWAIIGVIVGGRLGYTLFYNFEYYVSHPLEVFKIWQGGMAFHGGALGVIAALFLFSWFKKVPLFRLSDIVAIAVPIGLFFGRIANFVNGELYGRVSEAPWAIVFPGGGDLPRHPSQLYEALLEGAVLFTALHYVSKTGWAKDRPGVIAGLFLVGYGIFRSFVELFREPDAHIGFIFGQISMGQMLSLPMIVIGLGMVFYVSKVQTASKMQNV